MKAIRSKFLAQNNLEPVMSKNLINRVDLGKNQYS